MTRSLRSPYLTAVLLLMVLVLGAGLATYLLGGSPAEETEQVVLAPRQTATIGDVRLLLHLEDDSGDSGITTFGDTDFLSVQSVFLSEGYVFVVDRVTGHDGSRVRWFDSQGQLAGTQFTPLGSTLHSAAEGGFSYVVAKSGGDGSSESAVLVSVADGAQTSYTIPLQVNSGALWVDGRDVYARIDVSQVDPATYLTTMTSKLVPVAIGGVQVDDATAAAETREAWGMGLDGRTYTRQYALDVSAVGSHDQSIQTGDGPVLQIPTVGSMVGADADGDVYVYVAPDDDSVPMLGDAAYPTAEDPSALVLMCDSSGDRQGRLAIPRSLALPLLGTPVTLVPEGLLVVTCDVYGFDVYLFEGVDW